MIRFARRFVMTFSHRLLAPQDRQRQLDEAYVRQGSHSMTLPFVGATRSGQRAGNQEDRYSLIPKRSAVSFTFR